MTVGPLAPPGEQWTEFYALLAIRQKEDPSAFVTAEQVHRLAAWHLKKLGSVGKEVARHLTRLRRHGAAGIVFAPEKTKAWRLGVDVAEVKLRPSPAAVSRWLESRRVLEGAHDAWGRELLRLVEAMVLLRKGCATAAEELLGHAPPDVRDPALRAWRALLEGRAAYLAGDDAQLGKLDTLIRTWSRSADPAGRAVEVRLRSFRVMRDRFEDAARTRATLTKMVSDLEVAGGADSLGVMLNVLGVLERRSLNPSRAFEHLTRAASLLAISGDHHTLQAALFNAAVAYRSIQKRQRQRPDALAFSLLDLCLLICREFHVGQDSALAEITRAEWLLDIGELREAEGLLDQASHILESTEASYDQGYFMEISARLKFEKHKPMRDVIHDLNVSSRIFSEVGDGRAGKRVEGMRRRYLRMRPA